MEPVQIVSLISVVILVTEILEVCLDSCLSSEMANSWRIELHPSPGVGAANWLQDYVGAEVLRESRTVSFGVFRQIR